MDELNFDDIFGDIEAANAKYFEQDRIRQENVENSGNFVRGIKSGMDSMQGSLYGAVGLLGDAADIDAVRDFGFEGYQRNQEEAGLNPVDVQNFTDIETVSDAGKWFAGTLGQLAPSVAEGLVTTLIGAGIGTATAPGVGTAGGALAGLTGRKVVLKAIDKAVESRVKAGIAKEIAEKEVKEEIIKRATLGGNIGLTEGTAAIEGGGMWGEDAEKHGVENANAASAFALGQVSGLSETISPGGMLIKRIAGVKEAGSKVANDVSDEFLKRLGTEIPKAMSGEAAQEVFQSFLGVLNEKINDPTVSLADRKALFKYLNAGAAGAAGGLVFGGVNAVFPEKPTNTPPPPPPPAHHTVDDVLNEKMADDAVTAATARQAISQAPPLQGQANTIDAVLSGADGQPPAGPVQPSLPGAVGQPLQPGPDDISRLDPFLREMATSLYPKKEKGESLPDWVKLKTLKAWEKETGEDVKSYVSSTSAKDTLQAVLAGKPLDAKQSRVWEYLKSVAENKAMTAEQAPVAPVTGAIPPAAAPASTGDFPADWGAAPPTSISDIPTWDTIKPGDTVTLYRGENADNEAGGQWWTTDKAKAERFGAVQAVTLPADVVGKYAAQGHGGSDEFVFPSEGKRPHDLATIAEDTGSQREFVKTRDKLIEEKHTIGDARSDSEQKQESTESDGPLKFEEGELKGWTVEDATTGAGINEVTEDIEKFRKDGNSLYLRKKYGASVAREIIKASYGERSAVPSEIVADGQENLRSNIARLEEESKQREKEEKQPVSEKPQRTKRDSSRHTVHTEDGDFDVVVMKLEDGGIDIITPDTVISHNSAFSSGKTVEEILAYDFEPVGYTGSTEQTTAPSSVVESQGGQSGEMPVAGSRSDQTAATSQQVETVEHITKKATAIENDPFANEDEVQQGNEGRFQAMVQILKGQQSAEDVDAIFNDMAPVFKRMPGMERYAERWQAARDQAVAKLSPPAQAAAETVHNAERHEVIDNPDSMAHEQELNTAPSEAQKEAGNYKKGHVRLDGLDISIENPAGTARTGTDAKGKAWRTEMKADYGYVKGSRGYDKDHVDVFIAPGYQGGAQDVFVVDQYKDDGSFDEHKVVVGVASEDEAMALYKSNYEAGWNGGKAVTRMPMAEFKEWAKSDAPKRGAVAEKPVSSHPLTTNAVVSHETALGETQTPGADQIKDGDRVQWIEDGKIVRGVASEGWPDKSKLFLVPDGAKHVSSNRIASQVEGLKKEDVAVNRTGENPVAARDTLSGEPQQTDQPAAQEQAAPSAGPELVSHTVKKTGKVIKGVVIKGVPKARIQAIDKFTFPKDGGLFVREKHISELEKAGLLPASGPFEETAIEAQAPPANTAASEPAGDIAPAQTAPAAPSPEPKRSLKDEVAKAKGGKAKVEAEVESSPTEVESSPTEAKPSPTEAKPSPTEAKPSPEEVKSAPEEAKPAPAEVKSAFADNKVFTSDMVAAARKRLAEKRNTLRSGFDPELVNDLLVIGGAYFESGVREFSSWVKTVIDDIGEEFRPYLRGTYENLRHFPDIDKKGMSSQEDVEAILSGKKKGEVSGKKKEQPSEDNQNDVISQTKDGYTEAELASIKVTFSPGFMDGVAPKNALNALEIIDDDIAIYKELLGCLGR